MTQPGFRDLQRQLIDLAERTERPDPVYREIAADLRSAQRDLFGFGGKPRWKPLSPEYVAQKAREGRRRTVGVYTGGLLRSLTVKTDRHHVERITRTGDLVVGSSNPVSHLFGGKHRTRQQPRRKPFLLTPQMRRDYLAMVQDYLAGGEAR